MKSLITTALLLFFLGFQIFSQSIPLPEHPRPDFERPQWQNLNGEWDFKFDPDNVGEKESWSSGKIKFSKTIMVPFPWGSKLSGLEDEADIGWYKREIKVPTAWKGKRIFLTIGAADWSTKVWLDGKLLGSHEGGYVPFSFELSEHITFDKSHQLIIRVDDIRRDFTLYGKQGYGNARGIWQTPYLEARGKIYLETIHFSPDIDQENVMGIAYLSEPAEKDYELELSIKTDNSVINHKVSIPKGQEKVRFEISIPSPHLWSLNDPFLYGVEAQLDEDQVSTYFGMRKISIVDLPGTQYPYIALNDQPVYLQLALDQSYHPEGFYTFPSDQFMREEIERSKSIGLNGIRTHIKVEVPRKLYWADKLGLLVMEDLPNSWGEPDLDMQKESEYTLREMIKRDYNHPSIFSWVTFNETWGLRTNVEQNGKTARRYLPETQHWVASMYYLTKSLDPTRLVEDNSICCGWGHTETDINSWHAYLPGWEWDRYLRDLTERTYAGSTHHFEQGFSQAKQPNINSECGNVWGYEGSTGDVDWSWDYHRMINTFRKYPKVAGWLYTEHHDVINEWNGYWRFDRSEKETGLGAIVDGMSLNDLHAPVYLSTGNEICRTVSGGSEVVVPLYLSVMTGEDYGKELILYYELETTNYIGETEKNITEKRVIPYQAWKQETLNSLRLKIPDVTGLAVLKLRLESKEKVVLNRNFIHFDIKSDTPLAKTEVFSIAPSAFKQSHWSKKEWKVLGGRKVNGAGKGFFEFEIGSTDGLSSSGLKEAFVVLEASAKELFVKDQENFDRQKDYMKGARAAPSANPNAYPMTDETFFSSTIGVLINGKKVLTQILPDDPADHRGVLSWHYQLKDRKLREAGSYGYLVKVPLEGNLLEEILEKGKLTIRLQTEEETGIAIYGKEFGRYPLDPTLVFKYE